MYDFDKKSKQNIRAIYYNALRQSRGAALWDWLEAKKSSGRGKSLWKWSREKNIPNELRKNVNALYMQAHRTLREKNGNSLRRFCSSFSRARCMLSSSPLAARDDPIRGEVDVTQHINGRIKRILSDRHLFFRCTTRSRRVLCASCATYILH